ncbi:MAG: membrane protein [Rhizobiaceae bacterium MnEN-MB40S]|nr:MAG: membrane protein [Rhizobiaceae bacterium MnEN-MB40S]
MRLRAYALLVATTMMWAGNTIVGKLAVGHISPAVLTHLRWTIAIVILFPIAWPHLKKEWPVIRNRLPYLFVLGTLGFTIFNNLFYIAFKYTSALNVAIEQASMPLFIFILSFLIFGSRPTRFQIIGFAITITGVATVASHGQLSRLADLDVGLGDGLILLAVVSYGAFTLALRWKPDLHWASLMLTLSVSAFIGCIPVTLWEYSAGEAMLPDTQGLVVLIYAALFPSILAQVFYIRGNELIGAGRAGAFINLVPLFATGLAVTILGEQLMLYHIAGIVLVLGGITLAEQGHDTARKSG